jgi:hypothetical protein
MGFKFNPLTGELDLVGQGSANPTASINIPAGQTVTIDSSLHAELKSISYFINLHKSDFTKIRSFKMSLVRVGSQVQDSVYSRIGNDLDCAVVSDVVGLNATIAVTNNEAFDITCSFNKNVLN